MSRKSKYSPSTVGTVTKAVVQSGLLFLWAALSLRNDRKECDCNHSQKSHHTVLSVIMSVFVVVVMITSMILSIAMLTTVDEQHRSIFGYRMYIVKTDSMSPSENNEDLDVHFSAGDIIFAKVVEEPSTLQEGDVIAFISTNTDTFGETVTHMIREVKRDSEGNATSFVTYGTNTDENDDGEVTPDRVLGKYVGKIAKVGNFFSWMKSPHGYLICVLLPLMFLLAYYGIHSIKHSKAYD